MKDTNFFEPYIETREFNFNGKKMIIPVILAFIVFIMITYPLVNKIRMYRMDREIMRIDEEVNSTDNKMKKQTIENKRLEIGNLKEKNELLTIITNDFSKKDNVGDFLVYSITDSMTGDMFLKSLEITGEEAIVVGISKEKESIAKLERSLRRISYFKDIFIPNITMQEEFYEFTVNIKINSEEVNIKKEEQAEESMQVEKIEQDGGEEEIEVETE